MWIIKEEAVSYLYFFASLWFRIFSKTFYVMSVAWYFNIQERDCINDIDGRRGVRSIVSGILSIGRLADAKRVALRRGVWFKLLNRVERGVVDLTTRYVGNIKSTTLAKVLMAIIDKLTHVIESNVDRMVRTIGEPLSQKISSLAVSWGNSSASSWAGDRGFALYLAFNVAKKWRLELLCLMLLPLLQLISF